MTEVSPFLSVTILNVNELNFPLKTKVSIRDETHHPTIRDLFEIQWHNILKVKVCLYSNCWKEKDIL